MQDRHRPHGSAVADFSVPPSGMPWRACYFDGCRAFCYQYGRRRPDCTAPMEPGGLVRVDIGPDRGEPMKDHSWRTFTWCAIGHATQHEIGRALAADLGATYCETKEAFEALVERMKAADPLGAFRLI